jgi:KipI family sensor histidine kinase inhibitor
VRVAERALLVRFPGDELPAAVARAQALSRTLDREESAIGERWVLGAGSLLIRFAEGTAESTDRRVRQWIASDETDKFTALEQETRIAVEFGGRSGPDLGEVAQRVELGTGELIERLCSVELVVAFVGFSPGFPYLIGLPKELELPRRASPRARVPAGSVAIAGPFAGVYPSPTPGGWHLLGRTELPLFDPRVEPPSVLAPGGRVRFEAI